MLLGAGKATPAADVAPQSMKLHRLAIVDDKGVERLVLEADSTEVRIDGKVQKVKKARHGLILFNANGDEVGGMSTIDGEGSAIILDGYMGNDVSERVGFVVKPDGSAYLFVNDGQRQERVHLGVDEARNTSFKLLDGQEQPRVDARVQPDGKTEWSGTGAPANKAEPKAR
ncbi:hypothetical protein DAT35_23545 [Vitiosangium sp. GDMCC 1.1324]|nr:hypothetical protein DAT35_23545 [Vitiosangium sp. GDMCC 1.1324]